jgi:hypothetical protein
MRALDIIKQRPSKILTIFDIDDTLFRTTAKIKVIKNGQVIRTLTNQEFNNYQLNPGEEFDFGEFRSAEKFRKESEPIENMLDELRTILDHTRGKVILLTARADFDNKEVFLQTFRDHGIDIDRIHVHRAGNIPGEEIPAEKKAVWVRRYLNTGKYDRVSLYDDSMSNLRVFKNLEKEYPSVKFDAYYIDHQGSVNMIEAAGIEERAKKKKRSKRLRSAAWGPGPFGGYGYATGYSGDGGSGDGGGGIGEASYEGNIGAMETIKFYQTATPEEKNQLKQFIKDKENKLAWMLIQRVVGQRLQGKEFNADGDLK